MSRRDLLSLHTESRLSGQVTRAFSHNLSVVGLRLRTFRNKREERNPTEEQSRSVNREGGLG